MKISLHIEDITPEDLPKLLTLFTNVNICKQDLEDVDLRKLSKGGSKSKFQIPFSYLDDRAKYQKAFRICKRYGKPYPEAIKLYDAEIVVKGAKGKPETVDGHFNKWHIPFDATTEASKYEYARKVCAKLNLTYDEALKLGKMWPGHHSEWQIPFTFRTQRKEYTEAYAVCRKYNLPYSEALKKKEEEDAKKAPKETQSLVTRTEDVSIIANGKFRFPHLEEMVNKRRITVLLWLSATSTSFRTRMPSNGNRRILMVLSMQMKKPNQMLQKTNNQKPNQKHRLPYQSNQNRKPNHAKDTPSGFLFFIM